MAKGTSSFSTAEWITFRLDELSFGIQFILLPDFLILYGQWDSSITFNNKSEDNGYNRVPKSEIFRCVLF